MINSELLAYYLSGSVGALEQQHKHPEEMTPFIAGYYDFMSGELEHFAHNDKLTDAEVKEHISTVWDTIDYYYNLTASGQGLVHLTYEYDADIVSYYQGQYAGIKDLADYFDFLVEHKKFRNGGEENENDHKTD